MMDNYKVDRYTYVIFLIIITLLISLVEMRQRKFLRDITGIKQTVEQIELNTDPVEIVEEMEVETVFVEIWSNLIEVRVDTVEIFIDTEENKRGPWRERKQGKKEE